MFATFVFCFHFDHILQCCAFIAKLGCLGDEDMLAGNSEITLTCQNCSAQLFSSGRTSFWFVATCSFVSCLFYARCFWFENGFGSVLMCMLLGNFEQGPTIGLLFVLLVKCGVWGAQMQAFKIGFECMRFLCDYQILQNCTLACFGSCICVFQGDLQSSSAVFCTSKARLVAVCKVNNARAIFSLNVCLVRCHTQLYCTSVIC